MAGCGNHGCFIEKPEGQGTHGRCNCLRPLGKENEQVVKRKLTQLEFYKRRVEELEKVLSDWLDALDIPEQWMRCRNNAKIALCRDAEPKKYLW